jgi:hypothetical protein
VSETTATFIVTCWHCDLAKRFVASSTGQSSHDPRLAYWLVENADPFAGPGEVAVEYPGDHGNLNMLCPQCARHVRAQRLQGETGTSRCDGRCWRATGHVCICTCGGENHGKDYDTPGRYRNAPASES